MQRAVVRVPPLANHAVIFNTDERSYHGFPDPLGCPPGVMRKSLALYYYTVERDGAWSRGRPAIRPVRCADGSKARDLGGHAGGRLYSKVKSAFGLSDDFASRTLAAFHRRRRRDMTSGAAVSACYGTTASTSRTVRAAPHTTGAVSC